MLDQTRCPCSSEKTVALLSTLDRDTSLLAGSPGLQQRPLETPVLSLAKGFGIGSPSEGIIRASMDVSQLSFTLT